MKKILILCTGNSCRSQMAQALINHYLHDKFHADSAGINPAPAVAENAIFALKDTLKNSTIRFTS